jgi:NAD(P)-dependent dehydrogenase (short-subunit alcohol dehydrogenase family)
MKAEGTAVVTGASRGIGRAVAIELADRGFDVVATMRNLDDAGELGDHNRVRVARVDVTEPASIGLPDGLRVLVNNAGVEADYLPIEHAPIDMWRTIFETNVFGLIEVTRRAVPLMRAAGGGVIANVTSSSLLAPMPFYAAYRASKAAVGALGESLRAEVAQFGIRVIEIMPGPIATDMLAASARMPEAASFAEYRDLAERVFTMRHGVDGSVTSPADAARAIADAIFDDDGPLRYGCDPLAAGMLDAWRQTTDEAFMRGMLTALA